MPEGYYDVEISNLALIEACWGAAVADQVIDLDVTRRAIARQIVALP